MRVVQFIHDLELGGCQRTVEFIVRGSRRADVEYFVYAGRDGVLRANLEAAGATVRIIERRLPKFDPGWIRRVSNALESDRPDVVHTHMFGDCLHGYLAARVAGRTPVVMTLHSGAEAQTALRRAGYRWLMNRVSGNAASSNSVRKFFRTLSARSTPDIRVIPNGIEISNDDRPGPEKVAEIRRDLDVEPGDFMVVAVGRLVPEKGYPWLLQAVSRVVADGKTKPVLVIVGSGPLDTELRDSVAQLGISDHVRFAGFRSNVVDILRSSDLYVSSSTYEGFSLAVVEAMGTQRPVVVTDLPGNLDAVTDGVEALVVPARNVASMAHALTRMIDDPELRQRLAAAAAERFRREFTAERMAASYENFYDEVVAARPG